MKYLLDTNICIYIIKKRPQQVVEALVSQGAGDVGVSSISVAELRHGAARSQNATQAQAALDAFLLPLMVVEFDAAAAAAYGAMRTLLEKQGTPIGPFDLLIAAHALSLDVTLVTNNEREFRRVPKLSIVNWAA